MGEALNIHIYEKSSPGDGFPRPKTFDGKRQREGPLQHRKMNSYSGGSVTVGALLLDRIYLHRSTAVEEPAVQKGQENEKF